MEQNSNNLKLLNLLKEENVLTETNLKLLAEFQAKWEIDSFEAVLENHLLSEAQLADILASYYNVQRVYALPRKEVSAENCRLIDFYQARQYGVFPLGVQSPTSPMRVVLFDPTRQETITYLDKKLNRWDYVVSERKIVVDAINRQYPISSQIPHLQKNEDTLE